MNDCEQSDHISSTSKFSKTGGGDFTVKNLPSNKFVLKFTSDLRPSFISIPRLSVNQMVDNTTCSIILFHRIEIYPVDCAIQHLNNRLA